MKASAHIHEGTGAFKGSRGILQVKERESFLPWGSPCKRFDFSPTAKILK
jgi:hypothetical protein